MAVPVKTATRRRCPAGLALVVAVVAVTTSLAAAGAARAVDYLTAEEARTLAFPEAEGFERVEVALAKLQRKAIEKAAGVRMRFDEQPVWRVVDSAGATSGWFVVDEVLGKHEFITYSVALDADGAVRRVEILSYRETHGGEVENPRWLDQFEGKTSGDELRFGREIANITGATLSCKHLTQGVRRVLALYREILAPLGGEAPE